jgi:hypothetical protein
MANSLSNLYKTNRLMIKTFPTYAIVMFRNSRRKSYFSIHTAKYIYIQGHPIENHFPTLWNPIGRNMPILSPVLSPSSILPPHSSHCVFFPNKGKSNTISENILISFSFLLFKNRVSLKLRKLKLRISGSV